MTTVTTSGLYIGLMSGTSLDGIDGVLAEFPNSGPPRVLAHAAIALPPDLRAALLALNQAANDEIHAMAQASLALASLYAEAVRSVLAASGTAAKDVRAIGAHGQTIRHRPDIGYTLQLNAPAHLAEASGIAVVADLRSRDVAAGGQGAPLVPAFHASLFGTRQECVIVNLGGIANITALIPGQAVIGYDTGPANILLDAWCLRHTSQTYDKDGKFAASGLVDAGLLTYLLDSEPWFALPPPKSTGREQFNMQWLEQRLDTWQARSGPLAPADVQATLQALTACTVAQEIRKQAPGCTRVWVCGGGAHNPGLIRALASQLSCPVSATDRMGVPAQQMEALAFAWLAKQHVEHQPGNLPDVTGARGPRILGAYYPA